jgi:riboflavin synthase
MFTGLVEQLGRVIALNPGNAGARLVLDLEVPWPDTPVGASIAVDGCCLTAVNVAGHRIAFDLHQETLDRTRFAERLLPGVAVNLERPLAAIARLDGHFVQGHVDGVGTIERVDRPPGGGSAWLEVALPDGLERFVAEKGSIALDGVSLTCARVEGSRVVVALIPQTLRSTTFGAARPGGLVNVETDILAKYVSHFALMMAKKLDG